MAMKMSSSQSEVKIEIMLEQRRPIMSATIFSAIMKGDADVLIRCLKLSEESEVKVQVEKSDPTPKQTETEQQNVQAELQSATRFGDTVLHLLVTNGHNEVAQKVFQKDMSLLKAQNKNLETPIHCAAKVGNKEFIQSLAQLNSGDVKDALGVINDNEDTALHMAAKYSQKFVARELMNLDPEMAYKVNKAGLSPLHIAIDDGFTDVVKTMLEVDPTLGCTQFSDGTFPVHVAARMGNTKLVEHFWDEYLDYAELRNQQGRNLFHFAAAENKHNVFRRLSTKKDRCGNTMAPDYERMINAKDYDGNTPFHIAAMKGSRRVMVDLFRHLPRDNDATRAEPNNKGLTPFDLAVQQETWKFIGARININIPSRGRKFISWWFRIIMNLSIRLNIAEKTQVIGLGSVLITTVAFAAAFTFPGGYNADNGTPVLGRKYMFRAYLLANAWAFVEAFLSLLLLIVNSLLFPNHAIVTTAAVFFIGAASSMVVTFGIGSYLMLAPVSMPIAIIILVLSMFSWALTWLYGFGATLEGTFYGLNRYNFYFIFSLLTCLALSVWLAFFFALAK